jgi:hypothetical protein
MSSAHDQYSGRLRVSAAAYFAVAGLVLTLGLTLVTPSLWYWVCGCLFALLAFAWAWQPANAPGLGVGPILGLLLLFRYTGFSRASWYLGAILAPALAFVVWTYRRASARRTLPVVISVMLVLLALAVDRLFTNKITVRVVDMEWALEGRTPWGEVGPLTSNGQPLVVLYNRFGDSYCYDDVYSSELRDQLLASGSRFARVQYNTFWDFGRERSYNLGSVTGLRFNDKQRVVRNGWSSGGQILGSGKSVDCPR